MLVANKIREIRKEKGLTQKQLGELCIPKIGESTIRKYELGLLNPKIETLQKIAKALEIEVYELYGDSVDKRPTEEILDDIYTTHLISDLKKLNIKGKEEAVKQVKILTKVPEYQLDHVIDTVSKAIQDGHIRFVKKKDEE